MKFLWSPIFDQVKPPGILKHLGRRRGWLAAIQPALALSAACLAMTNPAASPVTSIAAAALVAFLSASQDIAIDAWSTCKGEGYPPAKEPLSFGTYLAEVNKKNYDLPGEEKAPASPDK